MTEQQNKLIEAYDKYVQLLSDELGYLIPLAAVHGWTSKRYEQGIKCREEISLLKLRLTSSPLPHQDGASAEDVVKATLMGYVDPNKVAKISGELMRVVQSETAKVVAEKDREIAELRQQYHTVERHRLEDAASAIADQGFQYDRIKKLQSDLSASNAHRTRLIESVKKWGGAWRTCRAELKEAKERIKELEEQIQPNTDGTY